MSQRFVTCAGFATVLLAAAFGAGPVHADTRGLLVGVGDYTSTLIPDLKGPPNDLESMTALLRGQGASDITVLRDGGATRASIEQAIYDLGKRAQPGDWLVIYFSGHGAQAQAVVAGDEDDNLDEFLVLSAFDAAKPDAENYITDNDFYAWFSRYVPASVNVLHIADACHSGTLNRSIDARAYRFTPRLALRGGSPLQLTGRPAPRFETVLGAGGSTRAAGEVADLPNVIFIGAAQDDQLALEASLPVEGAPSRGLLTYAFEQAMLAPGADGKSLAADADADGAVSVTELASYVDTQTRMMTGQRQQPSTRFAAGAESRSILKAGSATIAPPKALPASKPAIFTSDAGARALLAGHDSWTVAANAELADFVWDFRTKSLVRRSGDDVAQGVTTLASLRGVLEKWTAVEQLRPFLSERAVKVVVGPAASGARYAAGAKVELAVSVPAAAQADGLSYLTVVNLASDGEVQLLYPLKDDGAGRITDPAKSLELMSTQVVAPYGADHIVALVTAEDPTAFRRLATTVNGSRASATLSKAVTEELARGPQKAAASIGEIYTGPRP